MIGLDMTNRPGKIDIQHQMKRPDCAGFAQFDKIFWETKQAA